MMMTSYMEMRLRGLGYTQVQINAMNSDRGAEILAEFDDPGPAPAQSLEFSLDDVPELDPEPTPAPLPPLSRHDELSLAALRYAAHGLSIIPLHEPLFDKDGKCIGCTCEAYKRSKKYREWLRSKGLEKKFNPNYTCRTPGKHPRLSDWETKATREPAQVVAWWEKWPTANIGVAAGKSGLLLFDQDKYKDIFGDIGDLLTQEERKTPTVISGRGGENLVYQMPEGATYGNATGDLPKGFDIRGHGGQFLVWPSIHPCNNQYEWEENYSIFDCIPRPLPQALRKILDAAQDNANQANAVTFTTPTTDKPDLIRWKIGKAIRELIHTPPPVGQRSEADYSVALSLVYAGATDDDILGVFEHYPIGAQGKFAEAGRAYLALTIGKARSFVDAHPRPDVGATIDNLLLWVRTHSFEQFTAAYRSGKHYLTDSTDTKIADAILCEMKDRQRLTINVGKKRLGKLAGVGCNTALRALTRLHGWLFDVTVDPLHGAQVALCAAGRLQQMDPLLASAFVFKRDPSSANGALTPEINEYSPRKADEPFLVGTSRLMRERFEAIAQAMDITVKQAKAQDEFTWPGLGESSLRVIDALIRSGDMTVKELAEETGKKMSSIRTAVRKLVQHGVLNATRSSVLESYTYSLCADVWAKIDEVAPTLRNYTSAAQRENSRLKDAQRWCDRGIEEAKKAQDSLKAQRLEVRKAKLAKQRIPHLARLLADKQLSQDEIKRIAYEPGVPFGPHPAIQAKMERLHGQARMDLAESRHKEQWETGKRLADAIAEFKATNTPKRQWYDMLTFAGFTPNEAKRAIALGGAA
jgi:predicted transcriptional regulator